MKIQDKVEITGGKVAIIRDLIGGDSASVEILDDNGQYLHEDKEVGEVIVYLEDLKPWTITPKVGLGGCVSGWSDRHPVTVVEVKSPTTIIVQEDNAIRTDKNGMSDSQSYRFETDLNGRKSTYTLRKSGRWVLKGNDMKSGQKLSLGARGAFHDYSF